MEVGRKFIAQYNRSFFLTKGMLRGTRVLVILYELIAVLLSYIFHWDGGIAFPRDFTGLVMLVYFIVILIISYKFTKSTFELSPSEAGLTKAGNIFYALAFTSALFDTIFFWSLRYDREKITFYIIHFYVINFLLMLAECVWSLMEIPAINSLYAGISSLVYVGLYFLWRHILGGWMVDPPHGKLPIEFVVIVSIEVIYLASFWIVYAITRFRTRIYTRGLFTREESYHIIDSQSFK